MYIRHQHASVLEVISCCGGEVRVGMQASVAQEHFRTLNFDIEDKGKYYPTLSLLGIIVGIYI